MTVSCWHYLLLLKWQKIYGSSPHFQEDSKALNYVLSRYCTNIFWVFEVWSITAPKAWVGSTKTVIQHDLQQIYISRLLQCVFSITGLLFAYSRKWRSPGFRKTTLMVTLLWESFGDTLSFFHMLLHITYVSRSRRRVWRNGCWPAVQLGTWVGRSHIHASATYCRVLTFTTFLACSHPCCHALYSPTKKIWLQPNDTAWIMITAQWHCIAPKIPCVFYDKIMQFLTRSEKSPFHKI
jgi:hypothetical protein